MPRIKRLCEQYLVARRYGAEALEISAQETNELAALYHDLHKVWDKLALALSDLEDREYAIRDRL